ncbi:tannase/feruloyl esterase family alpha/beta hydrolase [Lichenicoccus roseus]|uniref:Tannase/feruloyl esterase family alpha/beta hydrolase n=1 Tax=Lichenicoccus roseus TaxID=2683649 RepID=A0A5R9J942_9PROT|nr:tannase/feruloyl esterase family alpha/beta hydrolase [Lichenicoccus roseus]TLU72101.1 tannase/feruloyl esterase family alpha/beta hydrolase [Lichenicoccus roseus]
MFAQSRHMFWLALPMALAAAPAAHASSCETISPTAFNLGGGATVVSAQGTEVTGGSFLPPGYTASITGLPAFCRVQITASSNGNPAQSLISIEAWLPEQGWNGRFIGTGNGGYAGTLDYVALSQRLQEGFAVANDDLGTGLRYACNPLSCGDATGGGSKPGGLYGNPQSIRDFGYAATHVMTLVGKQVTAALYGNQPAHSYFAGCSTGGQNAFSESQRFPTDYDGILAGAPAHNRTHQIASSPALYANAREPGGYLTNAALALIHGNVLARCAGHDGGLATDDFLEQPYSCPADVHQLICHGVSEEVPCTDPTSAKCSCLTPAQATTIGVYWNGVNDDLGRREQPGFERGAEEPIPLTAANGFIGDIGLTWTQIQAEPDFDSLFYWIYGPSWQWPSLLTKHRNTNVLISKALDAADAFPIGGDSFAGTVNANSTNLSAFARHGGRMLLYQGYDDPLIPSATAINYYTAVFATDPVKVNSYLRLFMAPGVEHCDGGPGANSFGATSQPLPPVPLDRQDDALGALIAWVEHGVPPTRITATKYLNDTPASGIAFQRPLCQYPLHAAYRGGDANQAGSFACVPSAPVLDQMTDPHWGD